MKPNVPCSSWWWHKAWCCCSQKSDPQFQSRVPACSVWRGKPTWCGGGQRRSSGWSTSPWCSCSCCTPAAWCHCRLKEREVKTEPGFFFKFFWTYVHVKSYIMPNKSCMGTLTLQEVVKDVGHCHTAGLVWRVVGDFNIFLSVCVRPHHHPWVGKQMLMRHWDIFCDYLCIYVFMICVTWWW